MAQDQVEFSISRSHLKVQNVIPDGYKVHICITYSSIWKNAQKVHWVKLFRILIINLKMVHISFPLLGKVLKFIYPHHHVG